MVLPPPPPLLPHREGEARSGKKFGWSRLSSSWEETFLEGPEPGEKRRRRGAAATSRAGTGLRVGPGRDVPGSVLGGAAAPGCRRRAPGEGCGCRGVATPPASAPGAAAAAGGARGAGLRLPALRRVQVRGAQELLRRRRAGHLRLLLHVRPAAQRELRGFLRAPRSLRPGAALRDPPAAQRGLADGVRSRHLRR